MLIKKTLSIPLGRQNDKEAYQISYHCVRLIINIHSTERRKKNKLGDKNKTIIGLYFMGFWNKH